MILTKILKIVIFGAFLEGEKNTYKSDQQSSPFKFRAVYGENVFCVPNMTKKSSLVPVEKFAVI